MESWEPAGYERDEGNSAEFFVRARAVNGFAGNTCGTVCGTAAGVLSAYRRTCPLA